MHLQSPIVKKHNQLWISEQQLLQYLPELSSDYFRVAARPRYKATVANCFKEANTMPDTGKSWRYSKQGNTWYYCFDNIPAEKKTALPCREELEQQVNAKPVINSSLQSFITDFINQHYSAYLHCYGDCTKAQQENLAKAAATLESLIVFINTNGYDCKKNNLFIEAAELLQQTDATYLPHNFRRLKEKVTEAMQGTPIASIITLPRAGNKNPAKYNDEEVESWIIQLREMGKNFTNQFIIRKIEALCSLYEKPVPSERWIGTIMQRHNVRYLTDLQRFGDKSSHANKFRAYIPLAKPLFAGDCWQVDATRVNIIPHKATAEAVGEARAKNPQYIFMIKVRDLHSGDVLGVEYDYAENRWAYHNALAMAVKESGYLPYQLVFDKFPGHNTDEFKNFIADLQAQGVKITFTSSSTGKASLERHFGTLQTVFMQESDFYYGEGIKSRRRYAHRSEQYLAALRKQASKDGYDFDAATAEADKIITAYRDTALNTYSRKYANVTKSPRQIHSDCDKPNVKFIEPKLFAYLFGLKKKLQVRNEGLLHTEIYKTEFIYRIADYNVIKKYPEVLVCYDLEDLSICHLYEVTDKPLKKYLGIANDESRVQIYGPDAQWGELNRRKAIIKEIATLRQEELTHRKAVGDDIVTLLTPGYSNKDEYSNAEGAYTTQVMTVAHNAADDYEPDVRNEY